MAGIRTYTSGTISPEASEVVTLPFYSKVGARIVRLIIDVRGDSEITFTGNQLIERVGSRTDGFGAPSFSGAGTSVIGTAVLAQYKLEGTVDAPLATLSHGSALSFVCTNASTGATKFQITICLWEP